MPDARVVVGASELLGRMSLDVRDRPELVATFTAPLVQLDDFRSPGWRVGQGTGRRPRPMPKLTADADAQGEAVLSQKAFESVDASLHPGGRRGPQRR